MSAKQKAEDALWNARNDMRTLADAAAITADRARMTAVKKVAATEIKKLQSVVNKPAAKAPTRKPK